MLAPVHRAIFLAVAGEPVRTDSAQLGTGKSLVGFELKKLFPNAADVNMHPQMQHSRSTNNVFPVHGASFRSLVSRMNFDQFTQSIQMDYTFARDSYVIDESITLNRDWKIKQ